MDWPQNNSGRCADGCEWHISMAMRPSEKPRWSTLPGAPTPAPGGPRMDQRNTVALAGLGVLRVGVLLSFLRP